MKRPAVLIGANCKKARYDTLANRGQLPFGDGRGNALHNEYSLKDVWRLDLMLNAPKGMDVETAQFIARNATYGLGNLPFYPTDGTALYAGAMFIDGVREAVSGRLPDIAQYVTEVSEGKNCQGLMLLNATEAAQRVQNALNALGLPESDWRVAMPEDISRFPEWFQKIETERRAMLTGWASPDTEGDEA